MIDSHHHLWNFSPEEFPWIDPGMETLRRDFSADDLSCAASPAGVEGFVAVQARQSVAETAFLLAHANSDPRSMGVVGWVPLSGREAEPALERAAADPLLKGVRHVIHDEPDDDFILGRTFNDGVRLLAPRGLVYDILIFPKHLERTATFVDQHPHQSFVLDHLGKPAISGAAFDRSWAVAFRELARRENVVCKLSGLVTEVRDSTWDTPLLTPYIETALEAFGPHRLMFGSDWPVCLLRASYSEWAEAARTSLARLSADERLEILSNTAKRVYGLGQ